jgi:hypothetical protein
MSPAVTEMLRQSGDLDQILSGYGLTFDNPPAPPVEVHPCWCALAQEPEPVEVGGAHRLLQTKSRAAVLVRPRLARALNAHH